MVGGVPVGAFPVASNLNLPAAGSIPIDWKLEPVCANPGDVWSVKIG